MQILDPENFRKKDLRRTVFVTHAKVDVEVSGQPVEYQLKNAMIR